ncbi:hypothetical protein CEQ90_08450 [Lewinellaceae bacterium SD302]|nr:hypothetical protein CEQ90_08450 [Lewinellaceae bacterium SD302]
MDSINKTHVDNILLQGQTGEAIKMLLALYQANSPTEYDNIVLQSARWHGLQRDRQSGVISFDNAQMMTAQINSVLRHFASKIERDWTAEYDLQSIPQTPSPTPVKPEPEPEPEPIAKKKVILCLSANPTNSDRLATDIEIREIKDSVRNSKGRDNFEVIYESAITIKAFRRAVLDNEPHIIHFSGHGTAEGEIILHNNANKGQKVSVQALADFFELISDVAPLECVILNACYSEVQAKAIAKSVDYVMGMNNAVPDKVAIGFAHTVYQVLANGRDYETAYKFARNNIAMEGHSGQDLPILIKRESI